MPKKKSGRFRPSDSRINITITPDGRIIHHVDVDTLNAFLNKEVDDPRLRGREWNPEVAAPTVLLASVSYYPFEEPLERLKRELEAKGIIVVETVENAIPVEVAGAIERNQPDIAVVWVHPEDGPRMLQKLYELLGEESQQRVIVVGAISRRDLPVSRWRLASRPEGALIYRHIREIIADLRKIREAGK